MGMCTISAGMRPCKKLCFRSDVSSLASALATRYRQSVPASPTRGHTTKIGQTVRQKQMRPALIAHIPLNSNGSSTRAADMQDQHNVAKSANGGFWLLQRSMQDDPESLQWADSSPGQKGREAVVRHAFHRRQECGQTRLSWGQPNGSFDSSSLSPQSTHSPARLGQSSHSFRFDLHSFG